MLDLLWIIFVDLSDLNERGLTSPASKKPAGRASIRLPRHLPDRGEKFDRCPRGWRWKAKNWARSSHRCRGRIWNKGWSGHRESLSGGETKQRSEERPRMIFVGPRWLPELFARQVSSSKPSSCSCSCCCSTSTSLPPTIATFTSRTPTSATTGRPGPWRSGLERWSCSSTTRSRSSTSTTTRAEDAK